jgi:glycosyltransferase involved in cell wall biosynthesis
MLFSVIIPVYNRPDEVAELLESLAAQKPPLPLICPQNNTVNSMEIIIIEDGSTLPCNKIVDSYSKHLNITYIQKDNSGRSDSRNVGMLNAIGDYFIFFDSDCIIPPDYFEKLEHNLQTCYADCFGGPDNQHPSFSPLQKAISYAMTSFWTTGGIRGGRLKLEKFKPRTFNMGFSRQVYNTVGGFKDMYGEDIDLSIRISKAGFNTMLYRDVYVWHKRRVSFKRFFRQVHIFGQARINLFILYPESLKPVHTLPALFVFAAFAIFFLSIILTSWLLILPAAYLLLIFIDALITTDSLKIAALSIVASAVQIAGYGTGFIRAFVQKIVFKRQMENIDTIKKKYK